MAITPHRSKVLFLPVIRGFYDRSMTQEVKAAMRRASDELGVDGILPADDAYTEGLICKDSDVRSYWEAWRADLPDVKALIAFSSDFMQERAVMDTTRLLPEDVPAFLIVNNDDPAAQVKGEPVGDTLCGSLSVHHNFRMLGRRFEQDFIDAGAIHCWGEFGRYFGIQSCSAVMLANLLLGKPVVCEVDACHAIMAKLANVMSGEPGVILDINNNGWDPRVFNVFHCSQTPPNWLIDRGEIAGKGIVQGLMQAVPFTAISAATSHDAFHATVFTGQFLSQDPGLRGSSGWAFVPNCQDVLKSVEETGIHHFVAMKGHRGAQVAAALRFKGLVVEDMSCEMPALEEIETELPSLGASACGRCGVYSE